MVSKNCLIHLRRLVNGSLPGARHGSDAKCIASQARRSLATIRDLPIAQMTGRPLPPDTPMSRGYPDDHVLTTIYDWPTLEPLRFAYYPSNHLYLPLRKDILHRAVVYEGDKTRQGTASTKWRDEVRGSHRKLYPQKGLGKARVGDRQSPIRRGGGVAFGPKPRDFATKLPRKLYDQAWRMALSHRYRRGELVVVDAIENLFPPRAAWWAKRVFERNGWGRAVGGSVFVTRTRGEKNDKFFEAVERAGVEGKVRTLEQVDVKNLLEHGRVVIEQRALNLMLKEHSSDLVPTVEPLVPEEERPGRITTEAY